jgi:hypothetical protein
MRTTLSLGLIAAAAGTLLACSSDEGTPRPTGAAGTPAIGAGGSGSGGAAPGAAGRAGGAGAPGAGGAPASNYTTGAALTINADGSVVDSAGATAITGAAVAIASPGNPPVTLTPREGALCFSGETVALPAAPTQADYTNLWGASLSLDLNLVPVPGAAADAGAGDAGVIALQPGPWSPSEHNVIGFSFKLVGQDPALGAEAGVPPDMRLQSAPTGGDPATQTGCANLTGPKHNVTREVLFNDIVLNCYNPIPDGSVVAAPFPGTVQNLGWQVNSASGIAYRFNFCVTDIKPILATP